MRKTLLLSLLTPFFFLVTLAVPSLLKAGDEACGPGNMCYPQRKINQWSCFQCKDYVYECLGTHVPCTPGLPGECGSYGGICQSFCATPEKVNTCEVLSTNVSCNTSTGNCAWSGNINNCVTQGNSCAISVSTNQTFGCCGPGGLPTSGPTPPSCSCNTWTDTGSCGTAGCAAGEQPQTRVCNPANCNTQTRCVADVACNQASCNCSTWTAGACGGSSGTVVCTPGQMLETRICGDTLGNGNCAPGSACCVGTARCTSSATCSGFAKSCQIQVTPVSLNGVGAVTNPDPIVSIISQNNGTISRVVFNIDPAGAGVASLTAAYPNPDNTAPYQTEIRANGIGSTTYTAIATMDDGITTCQSAASISVGNPAAWVQFFGGSVVALGNISSQVPATCVAPGCNPALISANTGEVPGVAIAGGVVNTGAGQCSLPNPPYNQKVEGSVYAGTNYNYDYFDSKASAAGVTFGTLPNPANVTTAHLRALPSFAGYRWGKVTGDCTLGSDVSLDTERVVLFVTGTLHVRGKVNLTKGRGSFLAVVRGDIDIDPNVGHPYNGTPDIEGLYHCDGTFHTGTKGPRLDNQVHIRGGCSGHDFDLKRDCSDNSDKPGEIFEEGEDQILLFPPILGKKQVTWREVAP